MTNWNLIVKQAESLIDTQAGLIANCANISALLYHELTEINWAGFYLLRNNELVLGPFQGKVACTRIPLDKGVCGHAASSRQTIIVEDVHQFPGHIACDCASNSEIVVPIIDNNNQLRGVIDIDSPIFNRFNDADKNALEQIAKLIATV